jgi:hypothetical protein
MTASVQQKKTKGGGGQKIIERKESKKNEGGQKKGRERVQNGLEQKESNETKKTNPVDADVEDAGVVQAVAAAKRGPTSETARMRWKHGK